MNIPGAGSMVLEWNEVHYISRTKKRRSCVSLQTLTVAPRTTGFKFLG